MKKKDLPKVLAVEWFDSYSKETTAITDVEKLEAGCPRLTIGYLVRETKTAYYLAQTLDPKDRGVDHSDFKQIESVDHCWCIPKAWIGTVLSYH